MDIPDSERRDANCSSWQRTRCRNVGSSDCVAVALRKWQDAKRGDGRRPSTQSCAGSEEAEHENVVQRSNVRSAAGARSFTLGVGTARRITFWPATVAFGAKRTCTIVWLRGCGRYLRRNARGGRRQELSGIIAQCLNLENEIHHTASKLFILGFEPLK